MGPERDQAPVPLHRDDQRLALRRGDLIRDVLRPHGNAVDRQDPVAGPEPDRRRGPLGEHLIHGRGRLPAADVEEAGEEDHREDEVRHRAGQDDRDPLEGVLAPVRLRREPVLDLLEPALETLGRFVAGEAPELLERRPRGIVVLGGERALQPLNRAGELGVLAQHTPEVRVGVARRRAVHAGNLHVAAERDRADAVLDPVPLLLDDRRREAHVEASRAHPDEDRGEEVAGLVDEDQEGEAEDGDDHAHATAALFSVRRRASSSAAVRSSRSRAGAPSTAASVSSTAAAMPRNGSRPARKAATATSFAAL